MSSIMSHKKHWETNLSTYSQNRHFVSTFLQPVNGSKSYETQSLQLDSPSQLFFKTPEKTLTSKNNNITRSESFKSKIKTTGKTPEDDNTKLYMLK